MSISKQSIDLNTMHLPAKESQQDKNWLLATILKVLFKVFPEGLMVDMASKNISSCTVSYTPLPKKTDLHFQPTLP